MTGYKKKGFLFSHFKTLLNANTTFFSPLIHKVINTSISMPVKIIFITIEWSWNVESTYSQLRLFTTESYKE